MKNHSVLYSVFSQGEVHCTVWGHYLKKKVHVVLLSGKQYPITNDKMDSTIFSSEEYRSFMCVFFFLSQCITIFRMFRIIYISYI